MADGDRAAIVLASSSPRRRSLLGEAGYGFSVEPPRIEEPDFNLVDLAPAAIAEALSYFKARSVSDGLDGGIVIGGDTVVASGRTLFGKPRDRADAARILGALAGTAHDVISGIALVDAATGRRLISHDTTVVRMKRLSNGELNAYLDTGAWKGKAGAYGIQDHGDAFVMATEGSFSNVVGMPMELITSMLAAWGVQPD